MHTGRLGRDRFELAPVTRVVNFGYEFVLTSDFGDFEVRGKDILAVRLHELAALEKLEEIGKTKAFAVSFCVLDSLDRSGVCGRRASANRPCD